MNGFRQMLVVCSHSADHIPVSALLPWIPANRPWSSFSPPSIECGDSSPPSKPCDDECRSPDGAACGAIREDADHKTRITPQAAPSGLPDC